jgi:ribosomal protein S18 acetylase RimI-like enzyme
MNPVEIALADLELPQHQSAILTLLDMYSRDAMGDGKPFSDYARKHLIEGLKATPTTLVFLAFAKDIPVGIAVCFRGFSTFAAKPLINIHDFAVMPEWRSQGIGNQLLKAVENHATSMGCCKLTLEVQEKNAKAQAVYHAFGFNQGQYVLEAGKALFFVKSLITTT